MKQRNQEAMILMAFSNVIEYIANEVNQIALRRKSQRLSLLSLQLRQSAMELREA